MSALLSTTAPNRELDPQQLGLLRGLFNSGLCAQLQALAIAYDLNDGATP